MRSWLNWQHPTEPWLISFVENINHRPNEVESRCWEPSWWTLEPFYLCFRTTLHSDSLCSEDPLQWPSWTASVIFSTVMNKKKTEKRCNSPDLPVTFFISLPNCRLPQKSLKTLGEMQCWVSLIFSHWDHYRFQQWPWIWNCLHSAPNSQPSLEA